jgi:flagellar biosynthesis/type III secretory pathway chaperone
MERFNEELKELNEKNQKVNDFNDEIMEDEKERSNKLNNLLKEVEPQKGKDTVPIDVTDFQNVIPS